MKCPCCGAAELVKLLKVLDRPPELLAEVRASLK